MSDLWQFLSGEVPGGFGVLLVLSIAFILVWEYVFRIGQTLSHQTYRRWRWLAPLLILFVYSLLWIQSPPKFAPLRIAVIHTGGDGENRWQHEAVADLTARRLRRSLRRAIVNPWEGAANYSPPGEEMLLRAGYRVYQVASVPGQEGTTAGVTVAKFGEGEQSFAADEDGLLSLSADIGAWILDDLGKKSELLDPFSRPHPRTVLEKYYRARQALRDPSSGRPDSARKMSALALSEDSTFTQARIALACCLEMDGDREGAFFGFSDAIQADTGSLEPLLALGEFYLRGYEWDGAEAALKVVLSRNPMQVRAYYGLARIHPQRLQDLRLNTPEALLKEAVRLDPAFESARLALAGRLMDRGFSLKARKMLQAGLQINPDSESLSLKLGAVEIRCGNPEGARDIYQEILKKSPLHAIALFNLGVVDYRTKQYDRAIENFRRSLGSDGPVDCYYYLGLIHQIQGDASRAIFFFQKRWELRSGEDDAFGLKARDLAAALKGAAGG